MWTAVHPGVRTVVTVVGPHVLTLVMLLLLVVDMLLVVVVGWRSLEAASALDYGATGGTAAVVLAA